VADWESCRAREGRSDEEFEPHLAELEALLDKRIAHAKAEGTSGKSVGDIFGQARQDAGPSPDA